MFRRIARRIIGAMAIATLFSGLAARLFGGTAPQATPDVERELVAMGVEAVVDAVDPRLRMMPSYSSRMAPAIARTIAHLRELAPRLSNSIPLSRSAWANDPLLNAAFATAADISVTLGRSRELRAFFADPLNAGVEEAHALMGMLKSEREVFAPAIVDGTLRRDVAQTTVSFSQHRLVAAAADELACRREVGVLILRRLAALALERITALDRLAVELEQRKAVLGARLRLLQLRQGGIERIAGSDADPAVEIVALERDLKAAGDDYRETKASLATLDTRLYHIDAIFGAPADYLRLEHVALRVNRLGYKVAGSSQEPVNELTLDELSIGGGLKAVVAFVRCRRAEIPPAESLASRGTQALL